MSFALQNSCSFTWVNIAWHSTWGKNGLQNAIWSALPVDYVVVQCTCRECVESVRCWSSTSQLHVRVRSCRVVPTSGWYKKSVGDCILKTNQLLRTFHVCVKFVNSGSMIICSFVSLASFVGIVASFGCFNEDSGVSTWRVSGQHEGLVMKCE